MAALAIILAIGVWSAFVRVIQTPQAVAAASTQAPPIAASSTSTTRNPIVVRTTTTLTPPVGTTVVSGLPFADGACRQTAPPTNNSVTLLRIYFNCGDPTEPGGGTFVFRTVPETGQRLTATLHEMVRGPTEEEAALGFGSFFNEGTADALRGVTISGGQATIDFNQFDLPDVAGTDQGRAFFVGMIAANALQFDTVNSVEIRLEGSCEAFSEFVGATGCTVLTADDV